jgi:2-polyprenyl-3-methyl-5-hydroxy-6-metoxy-1,4-benzoquinol methylase
LYQEQTLVREDENLVVNLTKRYLVGELMDAPDLAAKEHHQALHGLRRVNQWSRTASVIAGAIAVHCQNQKLASLRVLDLACGGGDVTVQVARQLNQAGVGAEVHGWDRSPTAIEFARRQDSRAGAQPQVQFEVVDAFADAPTQSFDVVYCTLFLHHLSDTEAEQLLKLMWRTASRLVLIDDLRRSTVGYALAVVGCHLLSRSPIVHVDGPLSVRAAFTESEILELSDRCALPRPSIKRHWPHRFLLAWGDQR